MYREKRYVRAPGPLDGKDKDALVVEVGEGEGGIAKHKGSGIRRAFLRICMPVGSSFVPVGSSGAWLYALGKGKLLWLGWNLGSDLDRQRWREEMKRDAL
jgi:hypothetical protein